jgi:cytochrome c oxidase subunit 2
VGLQLPKRAAAPVRRLAMGALLAATLLFLSACDATDKDQIARLAMPEPATAQAPHTFELWKWAWVAAMVTGVIVWGLIFWVVVKYRRRNDDEIPVQTRYNLPLEIFYTIAPIIMVIVFFYHTVNVQNAVLEDTDQDYTIDVVGFQWSWTFNHVLEGETEGPVVYTSGTGSNIPTLMLPVGKTVEFRLNSPDVIHSFGIPGFLMRMDVVPGRVNHYEVTPETEGTFAGKCYELCGTSHSRMLFNVEVVSESEYLAHLDELEAQGNYSEESLLGGNFVNEQVGLDQEEESE